jgi:aspartyl protease family protein
MWQGTRAKPGVNEMGHLYADLVVKGNKGSKELKQVLIDTGATFTVLPKNILEEIGAWGPLREEEVELGDRSRIRTKAYAVTARMEEVEAPVIAITFENAPSVIGVETSEAIGLRLDPTTGKLEFTRPKGLAYFY